VVASLALALMAATALVGAQTIGVWRPPGNDHRTNAASSPSASLRFASAPVRSGPSQPAGLNPSWRLAFDASFRGSRLDTSVWATCYPWMNAPSGCTNFGNSEYEWYLPSQVRVSGGALQLVAQRMPTPGRTVHGTPKEYSCRSGMVTTYPGFRFEYGYVQVVAQIPDGTGLWPALWLAASNLVWPPEIDILEHWGASDRARVGMHPAGATQNFSFFAKPVTSDLSAGWHTFGLSWTAARLVWFIDGEAVMTLSYDIPHQSMYLIADLAEASPPQSGDSCSGTMLIRSVKVWQP